MKKFLPKFSGVALAIMVSASAVAQTAGTLSFTFTPVSHSGYSGTKHVIAVWIESGNSTTHNTPSTFVKTKLRQVGSGTADHLPNWAKSSGGSASNALSSSCNKTDATTGATLTSYAAKTVTWDGKNVNGASNGTTVADGVYQVVIEETWNHGTSGNTIRAFTFTKGTDAVSLTPADDANFTNISLTWTPATVTGAEAISSEPELVVYPNPTAGLFTVDYKKANAIKVVNALGAVVYESKLDSTTPGSKQIDLSAFANGIYLVYLTNEERAIYYRVTLNR